MTSSTCIGCGVSAELGKASLSHWLSDDYIKHWLRVDFLLGLGVCSACPDYVRAWDDCHAFGPAHFDLVAHLRRQRKFSLRTFGPGTRSQMVINHIRKELTEIEADPVDVNEWVDVILLALDGAWRAGHHPARIALALAAKQLRNEGRTWPDWRTADPSVAIEHVREVGSGEAAKKCDHDYKSTYEGMDGERYRCSKCGDSYFLDYEEMK